MKFLAFCSGAHNSGLKDTRKECEDWGTKMLGQHANISQVSICQVVATMERVSPPIKITELSEQSPAESFGGFKPKFQHADDFEDNF